MKLLTLFFGLLLSLYMFAIDNDTHLEIVKEGLTVIVVDFEDGDKLKLFEFHTGVHILTKTSDQIDLSLLPKGKYLLENNRGLATVIEKSNQDLHIIKELDDSYMVDQDSERIANDSTSLKDKIKNFYKNIHDNLLAIKREGDKITVEDFVRGDTIKVFELKNTVHVLTKTESFVDLSQLPDGVYFIENQRGDAVLVEKFKVSQFADF